MTATAAQIAAALRHELPGVTTGRLHPLLYLAQGHHLAWFKQPLFSDVIQAWDTGPVVTALWNRERGHGPGEPGYGDLNDRDLNTVGYVASRYGALSMRDLNTLTTAGPPLQAANRGRTPGTAVTIDPQHMVDHFRTVDVDPEEPAVDVEWLKAQVAKVRPDAPDASRPDDVELLRERARRSPQLEAAAGG